jgi:hypothetical protein
MRILALGDMQWDTKRILLLLRQSGATAVLLAGDINEHTGNRKTWKRVSPGLRSVARHGARVYSVRGNWDECQEYDDAFLGAPPIVQEISDRTVQCGDLTIAGMSWFTSYSLPLLRDSVRKLAAVRPDILLAHAPFKQRVWLLECQPRLVITGHCGPTEHAILGDTVFVSLCGSFGHAIIDVTRHKLRLTVWEFGKRVPRFAGGGSFLFGRQFRVMSALREAREVLRPGQWIDSASKAALRDRGVPVHAINEFLSPNVRLTLRPN